MSSLLNRDEIRRLEKAAKEKDKRKLLDWACQLEDQLREMLRKEYDKAYEDELSASIDTFCIAIAYTLKYSETTNLDRDALAEFMEDMFSTVDMFKRGEYTPEDYQKSLEDSGIVFDDYQYKHYLKNKEDKDDGNEVKV